MLIPDQVRRQVNGINVENTVEAISALKLHLAELATICTYQGTAIAELQALVTELKSRPEVRTKPW